MKKVLLMTAVTSLVVLASCSKTTMTCPTYVQTEEPKEDPSLGKRAYSGFVPVNNSQASLK